MPRPHPNCRRLNHTEHPFNKLPALCIDQAGTVHVIRGPYPAENIDDSLRSTLSENIGTAYVVFTNRLDQRRLLPDGWLVEIGVDYTRIGYGISTTDVVPIRAEPTYDYETETEVPPAETTIRSLTEYAAKVRAYAATTSNDELKLLAATRWDGHFCDTTDGDKDLFAELLAAADRYDDLAADGWELTDFDDRTRWYPLYDHKPGADYAPKPRR